jgi:hypothetical protein
MNELFTWLAGLGNIQMGLLIGAVVFAMVAIPYFDLIVRAVVIFFKKEKPAILLFEYRLAPDHLVHTDPQTGVAYYVKPSDPSFVLEGGKIMLAWHVTGAYRVDVLPLGQKLSGNVAHLIAHQQNRRFTLVAHTLSAGKLTRTIEIPENRFLSLRTARISRSQRFVHRPLPRILSTVLTKAPYAGQKFTRAEYTGHPLTRLSALPGQQRYEPKLSRRFEFAPVEGGLTAHKGLGRRLEEQKLVRAYEFSSSKYSGVVEAARREFLQQRTRPSSNS